jgi:translation initiation factor IF-2
MILATVLAIVITVARWFLWRRRRPVARDRGLAVPAVTPTRSGLSQVTPVGAMAPAGTGPVAAGPAGVPEHGGVHGSGGVPRPGNAPGPGTAPRPGNAPGRGVPRGPGGAARPGGAGDWNEADPREGGPSGPRARPRPGSGPYLPDPYEPGKRPPDPIHQTGLGLTTSPAGRSAGPGA